ncbi:transporter substrate-binding domain-containing protein [Desulfococcus sp.]|uniref:transporter substrate-binding domain-containing protein n=1 Tax=Desulfococcus sp. TaxID=2025834 RepID=UPI0035942FD0
MKSIRWLIILLPCLILCPGARSPGLMAGEIDAIRAKGEIVVSLIQEFPPFAMMVDGQLSGLDVDLAKLLAEYLGVKVRFIQPETYGQQIPKLLSGESDIIIAAMTRTVERGLLVSFTDPYFEVSQAAMVRRGTVPPMSDSFFDLLKVKGLKLGVQAGTTHEKFSRELFPDSAIHLFPTTAAAVDALLKGEVNAMAADSPFVKIWHATNPEHYLRIGPLLAPVTKEYYAFAIRPGDPVFLGWLNLFIDQVKIDGTLDLLNQEYFEEMAWAGKKAPTKSRPTRAEMLKNEFIARKQAMIEARRKALTGVAPDYD